MRLLRIFLAGLAFGIGAGGAHSYGQYLQDSPPREQPRFVNPYGPPTQGSPYADRDSRRQKNPC